MSPKEEQIDVGPRRPPRLSVISTDGPSGGLYAAVLSTCAGAASHDIPQGRRRANATGSKVGIELAIDGSPFYVLEVGEPVYRSRR